MIPIMQKNHSTVQQENKPRGIPALKVDFSDDVPYKSTQLSLLLQLKNTAENLAIFRLNVKIWRRVACKTLPKAFDISSVLATRPPLALWQRDSITLCSSLHRYHFNPKSWYQSQTPSRALVGKLQIWM